MRERAGVIRELCCIQHLDTSVLYAIEWSDNWAWLTRLATELKGNLGVVEPETNMVLVRWHERDGWLLVIARRDRECFHVEDTAYSHATLASRIGLDIGLIPC